MPAKHHICVCICTFKRPRLLAGLLRALDTQETEGAFDYDIVVVDNDEAGSARLVVEFEATRTKKAIRYYVEPEQNIALARNKAVENARGDLVAFIDDDELPDSRWLLNMYRALMLFETAGVLGPVLPRYEAPPARLGHQGQVLRPPRLLFRLLPELVAGQDGQLPSEKVSLQGPRGPVPAGVRQRRRGPGFLQEHDHPGPRLRLVR